MSKIMGFLGILVLAGAVLVWKFSGDSEPAMKQDTADGTTPTPMSDNKAADTGNAMEATSKRVSTTTVYSNPAGEDRVGFAVTVDEAGVITDVTVDILAEHAVSKTRQLAFSEGIGAALKGKKLADLSSIDRVGGSSLTTGAFNDALDMLKAQL